MPMRMDVVLTAGPSRLSSAVRPPLPLPRPLRPPPPPLRHRHQPRSSAGAPPQPTSGAVWKRASCGGAHGAAPRPVRCRRQGANGRKAGAQRQRRRAPSHAPRAGPALVAAAAAAAVGAAATARRLQVAAQRRVYRTSRRVRRTGCPRRSWASAVEAAGSACTRRTRRSRSPCCMSTPSTKGGSHRPLPSTTRRSRTGARCHRRRCKRRSSPAHTLRTSTRYTSQGMAWLCGDSQDI